MTKWKETVAKSEPHSHGIVCPHCGEEHGIETIVQIERECQAEVSFKAGQRSVIEWIDTQGWCPTVTVEVVGKSPGYHPHYAWHIPREKWQQFKKEAE